MLAVWKEVKDMTPDQREFWFYKHPEHKNMSKMPFWQKLEDDHSQTQNPFSTNPASTEPTAGTEVNTAKFATPNPSGKASTAREEDANAKKVE